MSETKLTAVKGFLAYRYMNEEKDGKDSPAKCIQSMINDIQSGVSHIQVSLGCSVWFAAQRCVLGMVNHERRFALDKAHALKLEEIQAIIDMGLHSHFGSLAIDLPWTEAEALMCSEINLDMGVGNIQEDYLPNSIWIELPGAAPSAISRWLSKTAGILLTKIPLGGPEKNNVVSSVRNLPQWKHIVDMLEALCSCDGRCLGYVAIAAQNESTGYRFVPTIFGYDEAGNVGDMIELHKEITQNRKFRDVERFTAELCIRVILRHA